MDAIDSALLARHRSGDPNAMPHLMLRHRAHVRGVALRHCRDPHLADDVTQAVFALLLKRADTLTDAVKLPGWLATAAHYCSRDALRARDRRSRHERRFAEDAARAYYPEDRAAQKEVQRSLTRALAELGQLDRATLTLRYHEDLTVLDVSEHLGISRDAAAKRLSRALRRLQGLLERQGVTSPEG